jgi:hypothetical protein
MDRHRVLTLSTAAVLGGSVALVGLSAPATAAAAGAPKAQVIAAADRGGHVIIMLKQQFPQLRIKARNTQRGTATHSSQQTVVSDVTTHGGTGVLRLVSVNAVAANVSAAEVTRLRANPAVASILPDSQVRALPPAGQPAVSPNAKICPADPSKPLLEPEALTVTHDRSQPASSGDASSIATGKGVIVGLTGINQLAGNPNLIRPNGQHVVIDSPTPNEDDSNFDGGGDEWYGDASSLAAQGTVTYDFSKELPHSGLPAGCTFKIVGMAPDVSLVDTGYFGQGPSGAPLQRESQAIAGLDHAVIDGGASVISESYGYGAVPGQTDFSGINAANDALVAAGITVVESSGDSGVGGTVEVPASDPLVIDAGATTTFRLLSQAWGYTSWANDNMASLSSGGTTPTNDVVDLVAPGQSGEASCSPASGTCPPTTLTEAFGGTSQSAPFIAGAAADVIQAYSDSHGGAKPSPALVKQILTGSATDIGAAADDQGSGLLNVDAAVRAAQQEPGTTVAQAPGTASLVSNPPQVNVAGAGGSTSRQTVSVYNASAKPVKVTGGFRSLTDAAQFGQTVTEPVTAPPASQPVPAEGAQAAKVISVKVPSGLAQLGVDMITPNPDNNAVLSLLLFDPNGRLAQVSYDYSQGATGPVSNNEHVAVSHPIPGTWTAKVVWNNGRSHLQDPPPTPGAYRGNISVRYTGQNYVTSPATAAVTIPAHASATVPFTVALPKTPGDHPESVQFSGANGAQLSVPVTRRTLIPPTAGAFTTTLGSSVARGFGPLKSLQFTVPAGLHNLQVNLHTADASADNIIDYFLTEPNGLDSFSDQTPNTTPQGIGSQQPNGNASLIVANPPAGVWTVQAMIDLTTSGKEFTQTIHGDIAHNVSAVHAYNVPDSAGAKFAAGSSTMLQLAVTNTAGVGRTFNVTSSNGDITGPAVYIPAGATVVVTATLKPSAAAGTVVSGQLTVQSNASPPSQQLVDEIGYVPDPQSAAILPYQYTVG